MGLPRFAAGSWGSALLLASACSSDTTSGPTDHDGGASPPEATFVIEAGVHPSNDADDTVTTPSPALDAATPPHSDDAVALDAGLAAAPSKPGTRNAMAEAGASLPGVDASQTSTEPFILGVADTTLDGRDVVLQVRADEPVFAQFCARVEVIPQDPEQRGYVELVREMDYGDWYLDGVYEPPQTNLGCDTPRCETLTEIRFSVDRVEEIGRAPRPPDPRPGAPLSDVAAVTEEGVEVHADAGTEGWVPVYQSRVLSGNVFVRFRYDRSEGCAGDDSLFEQRVNLDEID